MASAASLRDLTTDVPVDEEKFCGALFDLSPFTKDFAQKQAEVTPYGSLLERTWLYDGVMQPIAFTAATALRGILAFLFVAAYIVVGDARELVVAARPRADALELDGLCGVCGRGQRAEPGHGGGAAQPFRRRAVGLRLGSGSGLDRGARTVSVRLSQSHPSAGRADAGGEGKFLRPLARNPRGAARYVTPARYAGLPTRAALDNVLMRATLKQVEGYWRGSWTGRFAATWSWTGETGRLSRRAVGSRNDLHVDLAGGYLLFIDPRQGATRAVSLARRRPDQRFTSCPKRRAARRTRTVVPPAMNILAGTDSRRFRPASR